MFKNEVRLELQALSQNEGFARVAAATFFSQLNPTVSELADIKTAVSEAVTNAIIHGYESDTSRFLELTLRIDGTMTYIEVADKGVGIVDIEKAKEPCYTSKPELERSGMGFTVMESFMDSLFVDSAPGMGTVIKMAKKIRA